MKNVLSHFAALAAATLLILPQGWCADSNCLPADTKEVASSCCQRELPQDDRERTSVPALPPEHCCCAWDATLPGSTSVQPQLESGVTASIAPRRRDPPRQAIPAIERGSILISSLRLHAMHSVWRC